MIENKLQKLLRECEPTAPRIDQAAIVEQLARRAQSHPAPSRVAWRKRAAHVAFASSGLAAALLVFVWSYSGRTAPPVVEAAETAVASGASTALEDSLRSSQQLEQELRELLAATAERPFSPSHVDLSSLFPDTQDPTDDALVGLKGQLRASESLWLLLETSAADEAWIAESIVELYPNTPAAARCRNLALN